MTTKKPKTSTSKTKTTTTSNDVELPANAKIVQLVGLCDALVAEIDNLMSQNLPPAQTGKILGDIITSFTKQYTIFK
tara:strand:+ start:59 stop:289 length:231 start_codon:yes stop_codon:yes gene_type:complete